MFELQLISQSAIILYCLATLSQALRFIKVRFPAGIWGGCAWAGNLFHLLALYFLIEGNSDGQNLSLFNMFALITWTQTFFLLIATVRLPVASITILILPISALSLWLTVAFPEQHIVYTKNNSFEIVHILLSVAAFGLLGIAAFQSLLIAIQESLLRKEPLGRLSAVLPPLESMERTLFLFIVLGFIVLSFVLGSGFLFLQEGFWYTFSFKLLLSIFSWLFFFILLIGRYRYGWRGKTIVRWTLIGFLLMVGAYLGRNLI